LVFHLLGKKFKELRMSNLRKLTQFLVLLPNLRIVRRGRFDPRKKISEM
jgi:hypothetical protein